MSDGPVTERLPIIRFEYTAESGNTWKQESPLWDDELNEINQIGEAMNQFLRLCTYVRKNDYILMEDVTEDEHDYLLAKLDEYRETKEHMSDMEETE